MTFVSPPVINVSVQTWYIYYWQVHFVFVLWLSFHPQDSMFLYRRGIFIIDRYILYSSYDFRFIPSTQCFCTDVVYLLLTCTFCIRLMTFVSPPVLNVSVQTRYIYYWHVHFVFVLWLCFTPSTQCFCTDVVYLLLTGTFCIRLMTFVSPPVPNVSVQTWYIYYWHVHFVFVLWLSFHPQYPMFLYRRGIFIIDMYILYSSYDFRFTPVLNVSVQTWYIYYWQVHFVFVLWLSFHPQYSMFLYRRGIFIIDMYILYSSYDFRFTPVLNVSVQTWYIYYWHVHFVFVVWLSFHPSTQCFCTDVVNLLLTGTFCIRLILASYSIDMELITLPQHMSWYLGIDEIRVAYR